jgi:GAF domain-containing protein
MDSPRGSALGDATVHNGKLFVIEDASLDPRFLGHPWVAGGSAVRFFAGFPIEASNGERIGALCISDPEPRKFSPAEDALLGMLARRVQVELWGTPMPVRNSSPRADADN